MCVILSVTLLYNYFDSKGIYMDKFKPPMPPFCQCPLLPSHYTPEAASMNNFFHGKHSDFNILGRIYILKLLNYLDFLHEEASNRFHTWNCT